MVSLSWQRRTFIDSKGKRIKYNNLLKDVLLSSLGTLLSFVFLRPCRQINISADHKSQVEGKRSRDGLNKILERADAEVVNGQTYNGIVEEDNLRFAEDA